MNGHPQNFADDGFRGLELDFQPGKGSFFIAYLGLCRTFTLGDESLVIDDAPLVMSDCGRMFFQRADMLELLTDVAERHSRTVAVSNRQEALEQARYGVSLPKAMPEWMSPMIAIIAAQLFTYHLGTVKGLDTDQPRGLTKVTKTI